LIHLKANAALLPLPSLHQRWRNPMPLDSMLVALAVTMMFLTFAIVVGWIDWKS
jgi:hypothetical protein